MSLLRFPEKRYLKNAIYGTVTLLPIAVVGPKPCVVSARLYPHRYDGAALYRYIVVDAENIGIIYDDAQGYLRFDVEPHKSLIVTATPTYVSPSGRGDGCTCGFSQLAALPSIRRGKGDTTASSGGETLL